MYRVAIISTDDTGGGAAIAAYRLYSQLRARGNPVNMFVSNRRGQDSSVVAIGAKGIRDKLVRMSSMWKARVSLMPYRKRADAKFSDHRGIYSKELMKAVRSFEVVHLYWVSDFIDYRYFFRAVQGPQHIVWSLADMNPFTGGCHYDGGCGRFGVTCGQCPALGSSRPQDRSNAVLKAKRLVFDGLEPHRMTIVSPSHWLAAKVGQSLLSKFQIKVIPNAVDLKVFRPRSRDGARHVLDLPQDRFVILFVAAWTMVRRKGLDVLRRACASLEDKHNCLVLTVGHQKPTFEFPVLHRHYSYSTKNILSLAYNAADLFVLPSLEEVFGQTAAEALACGTPVIGSRVGGIPEVVEDGHTGLLVKGNDAKELGSAVEVLRNNSSLRKQMSENARSSAVSMFGQDLEVQRYLALYEESSLRSK